jgi:L-fuconolactonase
MTTRFDEAGPQKTGCVDAHHHLWDLEVRDQPWTASMPGLRRSFSVSDLRPHLVANHIDATVVVQTMCLTEDTAELLALADAAPEVRGVVGWVDLCAPDVDERLASLRNGRAGNHLVGIRHLVQDEAEPRWLCRPDVRRGLAAVGRAGLVYDLLVRAPQLPAAVETVAAMDDVRFVLDHGGKPPIIKGSLTPWTEHIRSLGGLPNVSVKLSGLVTEADPAAWTVEQLRPYAEALIEAFGPARIMWGSDWPVCLLAGTYEDVLGAAESLTAALSTDERNDVFGGTARTWYSLEEAK